MIRPARPADRDAVVALLVAQLREHAIDTPDDAIAAAVDGALGDPARAAILVVDDGGIVAVAYVAFSWTVERGGRAAWLEELYVSPDRRGGGLGRALLHAAMDAARAAGAAYLDLEVTDDHARAANLYMREGFVRMERTRYARFLR